MPGIDLNPAKVLEVALFLWRLGHSPETLGLVDLVKRVVAGGLPEIIKAFQRFHGLPTTGEIDEATYALIHSPRCAHRDALAVEDLCRWPQARVTWGQAVALAQLDDAQVLGAFRAAWSAWAEVCGVEPLEIPQAGPPVIMNVFAYSGDGKTYGLDGPGGVLAWSQLPCKVQADAKLRQVFDKAESWTLDQLVAVATHEIGHALGLPHLGPGTLMSPYYNPAVTKPTAADAAEAVKRYGPPKNPAAGPSPPAASPPAEPTTPAGSPQPPPLQVWFHADAPGDYVLSLSLRKEVPTVT